MKKTRPDINPLDRPQLPPIKAARFACAVLMITLALHSFSVEAADAFDAQPVNELLRAGKPQQALSLLQAQEDARAGDPTFDYLLGVAALDSGRPDLATLAFERVLAVDPVYAGARVDTTRAYFLLKDYTRARAELDIASTQSPPEN